MESLSRLWYLSEFSNIDQEFDYFLIHLTCKKLDIPYILKSLSLLEIDPQKLIWFNEPTQIKSVVIPESSFSLNNNAYRAYQKIFAPIHRKFEKIPTTEQPLYLSRSLYKKYRNCAEEENLEKILISNGFNIIHPQYFPLEEQIYLFNRHKYILGATGSALYSIVFSSNHKTVIHISCQDDFVKDNLFNLPRATNHFLIAQCFNSESHYINSLKIKQDFRIINKLNRISNKFLLNLPRILEKSLNQYQLNIDLFCNELKQMGLLEKY